MSLEKRIESEFKAALKERDKTKVSTLRMLKSEMNYSLLGQDKKGLSEDDIVMIVQRQVKQHKDSISLFEKGNRGDLVEKEKRELDILLTYLPKQISCEELTKIINETIAEVGATTKKDMGKVIKAVLEKVKGATEGKKVSQIVSGLLA
ncbi:MAG: GatB/YqeY domain-containing protein [Candidatus Omnitrophota bacterium]